jgi:hypothetical protein
VVVTVIHQLHARRRALRTGHAADSHLILAAPLGQMNATHPALDIALE